MFWLGLHAPICHVIDMQTCGCYEVIVQLICLLDTCNLETYPFAYQLHEVKSYV